jgi:hypothetical protein
MASWVSPTIHVEGEDFSVTDNNTLANNEIFLYEAPYALYSAATNQSVANGTSQLILGATPVSNYGFSLSSNNAIVPLTGVYSVGASSGMLANSNIAPCGAAVYHNGGLALNGSTAITNASIGVSSSAAGLILATAGDTIGLYIYNGIGGAADTDAAATYLHIFFVGSQ